MAGEVTNEQLLAQLREMQARNNAAVAPAAVQSPMANSQLPMANCQLPMMPGAPMAFGQPGPMGMPGMSPNGPAGFAQPTGLLVAISVPTPQGEVTCHLQFGQEAAGNPQAVIMSLMQQGWPVKAYQRNGGGNFGGGGGGGFNRGGGFRRGNW